MGSMLESKMTVNATLCRKDKQKVSRVLKERSGRGDCAGETQSQNFDPALFRKRWQDSGFLPWGSKDAFQALKFCCIDTDAIVFQVQIGSFTVAS
eukprot:1141527-Pelagomonas_calceolata.AAC.1